jgi:hypothetical protein
VFWLVGGILGRDVAYRQAARSTELDRLRTHLELGGFFERGMVRPATNFVFLAGLGRGLGSRLAHSGLPAGWRSELGARIDPDLSHDHPLIVLVFMPRGRVFRAALDEAVTLGQVTPRLTAALKDPPWRPRAHTRSR